MTTRLITAGVVLVVAIIFGFIFINQFTANQKSLSGETPSTYQTTNENTQMQTPTPTSTQGGESSVPKNDSVSSIETDLNNLDLNFDSDSAQFDSQLKGF